MQYSKLLPKIQTQNFWFCTVNCTVVALSRLSKTGFASACVAWGFFHERGGPSYQYYCKIDAVTTSPPSHGSLPRRIAWSTAVVSITAWFITAVYNILYSTAAVSITAWFITVVYTKIFSTAVINITALFITAVYTTSSSTAVINITALFITAVYTTSCFNAAKKTIAWIITATQVTVGLLGPLLKFPSLHGSLLQFLTYHILLL